MVKEHSENSKNDEVHKSRNDRGLPISRYVFNLSDDLPTEPNEYYLKQKSARLSVYPKLEEEYPVVSKVYMAVILQSNI